jgi:hypothetical protein
MKESATFTIEVLNAIVADTPPISGKWFATRVTGP